jgi:hypothetical protein
MGEHIALRPVKCNLHDQHVEVKAPTIVLYRDLLKINI